MKAIIIARQELRSIFRERRFQAAAAILSILFALSVFGAWDYYASNEKQHAEAARTARAHWDNQEDKNPHSAAHYGTFVFKPIYPLSFFDRGIDAFTGNTLFLEGHVMHEAKHRAVADRSELSRLGALTPAFVLGILFPLFIIVLGFGSIASERESGNLRILLAQGLRPAGLFFGKSLGLGAVALSLALPFLLLGGLGLAAPGAGAEDWQRYGLMSAGYLIYLGCFIHLTLIVSAFAQRANVALVALLGIWIAMCLIAPKAVADFAAWSHPTPSWQAYQEALQNDLKNGVDGHDPSAEYSKKLEEETLKKHGVSTVDSLPFNWDGFIMQKGEEHETYVFQKHKDALLAIYQQQQNLLEASALLSPYLLVNLSSQRLAGTDVHTFHNFLAAAEKYRVALVGELNNDLMLNFKYGDWDGKRDKAFFASNKKFEYRGPAFREVWQISRPAMALLFGWYLLSGLLGLFVFQRIKPI
ncbi:MAG: DUF3526 domain-containing protein [Saprospiraceae bacterium]|nr:DUF3526 domain-containing protein [Saprospiraceae bacterium]